MHAIIKTGGKQYRVAEGQYLRLETLDVEPGNDVVFDEVLMIANGEESVIGAPHVAGAKVTAEVLNHGRHKKVEILKFKRRKHHMKRQGHRQNFTEVMIKAIEK